MLKRLIIESTGCEDDPDPDPQADWEGELHIENPYHNSGCGFIGFDDGDGLSLARCFHEKEWF